ncbi:hypothetical protein MLD38_040809 [Melastoma candidum]|nr:hypothetical protein MLD38_040809 [Melastoma candidum]
MERILEAQALRDSSMAGHAVIVVFDDCWSTVSKPLLQSLEIVVVVVAVGCQGAKFFQRTLERTTSFTSMVSLTPRIAEVI